MGRFTRKGTSKVFFVAALASTTAPSLAEINAGTDLGAAMAEMSGFTFSNSPIDTPDLANSFVPSITGEDKADNPTIQFYDDATSVAVRTALAKGSAGYVVLMPYGATATKRAEVWPVVSTGFNDMWTVGNEAAKASVQFAVSSAPKQGSTLAA